MDEKEIVARLRVYTSESTRGRVNFGDEFARIMAERDAARAELAAERAKREAAEAENAELWDALHLWENAFGTARDENLSHARLHALSLMERDTAP